MNAPLRQSDWKSELLLAANCHLIRQYQQAPSACLALQISRNYRLLITQHEAINVKQGCKALSRLWWHRYCEYRTAQKSQRNRQGDRYGIDILPT